MTAVAFAGKTIAVHEISRRSQTIAWYVPSLGPCSIHSRVCDIPTNGLVDGGRLHRQPYYDSRDLPEVRGLFHAAQIRSSAGTSRRHAYYEVVSPLLADGHMLIIHTVRIVLRRVAPLQP